jgi:fluoride exporter
MAGRFQTGAWFQTLSPLFKYCLLVGLGGGAGSIARFLCHKYISEWFPHAFPTGTLLVNISGCFLIGILAGLTERGQLIAPESRLLLITGLCGGFTTFSAFAYENIQLLKNGATISFLLYTAGSVVLGLLATFLGIAVIKAN